MASLVLVSLAPFTSSEKSRFRNPYSICPLIVGFINASLTDPIIVGILWD